MNLIFEKSVEGRKTSILPACDVEICLPASPKRESLAKLPELGEIDIERHYTKLAQRAHGVNSGFYPLGSCTMKYNPKISEKIASLDCFNDIHPLQPEKTVKGCKRVLENAKEYLCEITGMDAMSLQPAAGAHGELAGMLVIKAYHLDKGDKLRNEIIIPDSAHGTNPASAVMAGFEIVNIKSDKNGMVDIVDLKEHLSEKTAGLMLTNPNTLGIFDENILKITKMVHEAGGLCYYDGANLNAIMGIARPGDMGFDVTHLNLHKTFSTPHGGGGPGSGPCGCKAFLKDYLPMSGDNRSIGRVMGFYGNFLVILKALIYMMIIGADGIKDVGENAVLNANYMKFKLKDILPVAYDTPSMHEFVLSLEELKEKTGVSALDFSKALLDHGMHPPTMYFPLIVHEALMIEPTETESKETIDEAIKTFKELVSIAEKTPEIIFNSPITTPVGRLDEVLAARKAILRHEFES
jgi:glycine dehydrogenase subunit 2